MHLNLSHGIDQLNDRHDKLEGNITGSIKELRNLVEEHGMLMSLYSLSFIYFDKFVE